MLPGQVQQPVGISGIGGDATRLAHLEPHFSGALSDLALVLGGLLPAHPVLLSQHRYRVTILLDLGSWIELEAAPVHFELVAERQFLSGEFQMAPADVAERAGDVGPDLYLHSSQCSGRCHRAMFSP